MREIIRILEQIGAKTIKVFKVVNLPHSFKNLHKKFNLLILIHYYRLRKKFPEILRGKSREIDLYHYFQYEYYFKSPFWLRKHRRYFSRNNLGFGENAFHVAWLKVIEHFRPKYMLEVGVYRGQIISLWQLIANKCNLETEIVGISPMNNTGDLYSRYIDIDYKSDIEKNFKRFNLDQPRLISSLSTDTQAIQVINSLKWDLIYIDGNHDFEIASEDYMNSFNNLKRGGVLCIDDSSLFHNFKIFGGFKGHPGPSRIVRDMAMKEMKFLMTVGHNNFFLKK